MPAVYHLLPRLGHVTVIDEADEQPILNLYDPELWEQMGRSLAGPHQVDVLRMLMPDVQDGAKRRRIAMDHLSKCLHRAKRFAAAMDVPATPPMALGLHLFTGNAEHTGAEVSAHRPRGDVWVSERAPGDGTALRSSALLYECVGGNRSARLDSPIQWRSVRFLFSDHLRMTKDNLFSDNVIYLHLEDPR